MQRRSSVACSIPIDGWAASHRPAHLTAARSQRKIMLVEHEEHDRQRVLGVDSVEIPRCLLGLSEIATADGLDEGGVGGRGHRTHVRIRDSAEDRDSRLLPPAAYIRR